MPDFLALDCPACGNTSLLVMEDTGTPACPRCGVGLTIEVDTAPPLNPAVPEYVPMESPVTPPAAEAVTISPTGKPVIPPATVPYLLTAVGFAAVLAQTLPQHTLAAHICNGIVALAGLFGIVSPGLRK